MEFAKAMDLLDRQHLPRASRLLMQAEDWQREDHLKWEVTHIWSCLGQMKTATNAVIW